MGKAFARAFAPIFAFCVLFAFADKAAAQDLPPTTISVSVEPSDVVSINAEGRVIVLSQPAAGVMKATINATSYTLTDGEYVANGLTSQRFLTLNFIASCSVSAGCDAFGLPSAASQSQRIAMFQSMDLATLRQFAASGANLNERVNNNFLIWLLTDERVSDATERISILTAAGADINISDGSSANLTMLHRATRMQNANGPRITNILLAIEGIDVNRQDTVPLSTTPLLFLRLYRSINNQHVRAMAEALWAAGGRCNRPLGGVCNGI